MGIKGTEIMNRPNAILVGVCCLLAGAMLQAVSGVIPHRCQCPTERSQPEQVTPPFPGPQP